MEHECTVIWHRDYPMWRPTMLAEEVSVLSTMLDNREYLYYFTPMSVAILRVGASSVVCMTQHSARLTSDRRDLARYETGGPMNELGKLAKEL